MACRCVYTCFAVVQAQRRGIHYELLPPGMQRRKMNSSRFDKRSRTIFWHIHWQFPAAQESVHVARVSEQTPLSQVLQQHLSLMPGNSVRRHALRAYVEAGLQNLRILMKKEHCPVCSFARYAALPWSHAFVLRLCTPMHNLDCIRPHATTVCYCSIAVDTLVLVACVPQAFCSQDSSLMIVLQANKPEYHRVDAEKFLRQELYGKTVIEFPVLLVLLPGEASTYQLASDGSTPWAQATAEA